MTKILSSWCVFYILTNILTSGRTFWRNDVFLASWPIFDVMTSFLWSWHFVHHFVNKILWKRVFDVIGIMAYFWLHDNLLTCFWLHNKLFWHLDKLFDIMTYVAFIDVMTNPLSSWRIFVINSGEKYNENVISILWRNVWRLDAFLTSWQTF